MSAPACTAEMSGRPATAEGTLAAARSSRSGATRAPSIWVALGLLLTILAFLAFGAEFASAQQSRVKGADLETSAIPGGTYWILGADVDPDSGKLYAADQWEPSTFAFGRVHRFNDDGSYDTSFSVEESLSEPQDVAIDNTGGASDGRIYIAEAGANRITAIDSSGALDAAFGDGGRINGVEDSVGDPDAIPNLPGGFSRPCGVAVDQTNGDLYVADSNNNRIWIFDSTGAYKGKVADSAISYPCGIAFGSGGALYVRNSGDGKVVRFAPEGPASYSFQQTLYAPGDSGPWASDVATDPAGHVYVDKGDRITEYEADGNELLTFGQGEIFSSSAIAVDPERDEVFAGENGEVHRFGRLATLADATTGQPSNVTDASATVSGTIDPAGGPEATCEFEYGPSTSYGSTAPCDPSGPFSSLESVTAALTGLQSATTYHYRLAATNADGVSHGGDRTFITNGPPLIEEEHVAEVGTDFAELVARIRPAGTATSYRFEYVTEQQYQVDGFASANRYPDPDGEINALVDSKWVYAQITGLNAATAYRYRVVATNGAETSASSAKAFSTWGSPPQASAGQFPGQGFLPDGRAWELVSPPDKSGGAVLASGAMTMASPDGDRVGYSGPANFGDTQGSGGLGITQYIAQRGANGWASSTVTPLPDPAMQQVLVGGTLAYFNADLSGAIAQAADLPYVDDDIPGNFVNLYRVEPGAKTVVAVTKPSIPGPYFPLETRLLGGSADGRKVFFATPARLLADASPIGRTLYEWDEGTVRVASLLPDGTAPVGGSSDAYDGLPFTFKSGTAADDGSRVLFRAAPVPGAERQLYMRKDGATTAWVSEPEGSVPVAEPGRVQFLIANQDLSAVLFVTSSRLTDDDPGGSDFGVYLYRDSADPTSEDNLTFIGRIGDIGNNDVPVGLALSEDGAQAYLLASGSRLLHWDGVNLHQIGPTSPNILDPSGTLIPHEVSNPVRLSEDGMRLAFLSRAPVTGADTAPNPVEGVARQLYVYDAAADQIKCASCPPTGVRATSEVQTEPKDPTVGFANALFQPHFFTRDGSRVFFATADQLVPQDKNGLYDVYEYVVDSGERRLLSAGRTGEQSWFADASASGDDAFIITKDRLSAWDVDGAADLYDARVGGGFAEPTGAPPSCQGDACQPPPAVLNDPTPSSASAFGPGDPNQRARNQRKRNQRKPHRKCGAKKKPGKRAKQKPSERAKKCGGSVRRTSNGSKQNGRAGR